jgi:hypothetical protein
MKKPIHHPRYPQTLLSLQHLEGGVYGTLAFVAIDRETLEIRLGNDFVRVGVDVASHIAEVCERFAGAPPAELVVERVEEEESDVVVEVERPESKLARARRVTRRRTEG